MSGLCLLLGPGPLLSARERGCDQREMVSCHNTGSRNFDSDTVTSVHMFIFSIRWWLGKFEIAFNKERALWLCIYTSYQYCISSKLKNPCHRNTPARALRRVPSYAICIMITEICKLLFDVRLQVSLLQQTIQGIFLILHKWYQCIWKCFVKIQIHFSKWQNVICNIKYLNIGELNM